MNASIKNMLRCKAWLKRIYCYDKYCMAVNMQLPRLPIQPIKLERWAIKATVP